MIDKGIKVLFAASEALPFASTGGLADVIGSLPAFLVSRGVDARVIIPLYSSIDAKYRETFEFLGSITVQLSWRKQYCGIFRTVRDGVIYYFIDNEYYFRRMSMYGSFDDGERYAFFSRAILDIMPFIEFYPDILHTNDWQSALAVIYLKRKYYSFDNYNKIISVHTIHNIDYQGIYNLNDLGDIFDLESSDIGIVEYDGSINLTKGAIVCCDHLTTVSPRYSDEIQTETFSSGLHHIIISKRDKVSGILNGIDTVYYNPASDPALFKPFGSDALDIKAENKIALQRELELPEKEDTPMVAMISRLTAHKGLDLVTCVIEEALRNDIQFVLLGTGDLEYENYFIHLADDYPDKVKAVIKFDKTLSKRIYAAADIFLMPSRSEPCGLAQMIASRYGTVPLVRETGGLYDSIKYYDIDTEKGNGFTFTNFNAHDMLYTIWHAIGIYTHEKEKWNTLVRKIMNIDFSWGVSADEYIKLYEKLML